MKLEVTQENLSKALNLVGRVAGSSRSSLPVLQNVLLKASGSQLSLSTTNLEIAMAIKIGAKVQKNGSITVPARLTQDFISSLPTETVNLELNGTQLRVFAENYDSTINGVVADEFPSLPELVASRKISIPANIFKQTISQVVLAASHDETRPVLTGVWLHTHNKNLYMVATDSYRLAEKIIMPCSDDISLLIPASTMQDAYRIISDDDDEIVVEFDDQQVLFKTGTVEVTSRLIDGNYPDYRQLIPKETPVSAKLNKNELVNITKVSSLFAKESAGSIKLSINESDQSVGINSVASQVGENKAITKGEVKGDLEVSLNSRYLIEALGVINEEEVVLGCFNKTSPCIISPVNNKNKTDYMHIIMPLRS